MGIVDIGLGPEDAGKVCRRLAARNVPFFFFTGDHMGSAEWPDAPVLTKPATAAEILSMAVGLLQPSPDPPTPMIYQA